MNRMARRRGFARSADNDGPRRPLVVVSTYRHEEEPRCQSTTKCSKTRLAWRARWRWSPEAGAGLGKEIASRLARAGAAVVIADINPDAAP